MYELSKSACPECGLISGHSNTCSKSPSKAQSAFERGFEAGKREAGLPTGGIKLGCPECGLLSGHSLTCSKNPYR
jgi:hypothetical protein